MFSVLNSYCTTTINFYDISALEKHAPSFHPSIEMLISSDDVRSCLLMAQQQLNLSERSHKESFFCRTKLWLCVWMVWMLDCPPPHSSVAEPLGVSWSSASARVFSVVLAGQRDDWAQDRWTDRTGTCCQWWDTVKLWAGHHHHHNSPYFIFVRNENGDVMWLIQWLHCCLTTCQLFSW